MRPVSRRPVNKRASARGFRADSGRTAALNMRVAPLRGGWRL